MTKRCQKKISYRTCSNKTYQNNLCKKHFIESGGIVDTSCSVEECNNERHGHGLCIGHLHRLRRQGENFDRVTPLRTFKVKNRTTEKFPTEGTCLFVNCLENIEWKGLCKKHYKHLKKHRLKFTFALNELKNGCFVCGSFEKLCFDHDHKICSEQPVCIKCYRGILCNDCNLSLGYAKENKNTLKKMIQYLEK